MIGMNNLESLATEIGKDIKDIKTRFATKEEMHEVAEKKQDKDTVYNDAEVKQRLTALESRLTSGGSQKKDTGWITIKDGDGSLGQIIKIRRIDDMVHVQITSTSNEGLTIDFGNQDMANYILPESGFNTLTDIIVPIVTSSNDLLYNPGHADMQGLAIITVKRGAFSITIFSKDLQSQENNCHINSVSYLTDDPWPTTLP